MRYWFKNSSATGHIGATIYGDLIHIYDYKFKKNVGKPNFSDQFKKIIKHKQEGPRALDCSHESWHMKRMMYWPVV